MRPSTKLVVITPAAKLCERYSGRTCTHVFEVETDITAEKVEAIRTAPEMVGEPDEKELA